MAYIRRYRDKWRAEVDRNGIRKSRTFFSKRAAETWARKLEQDIIDGQHNPDSARTVADLLQRYEREVSRKKRGHKWEYDRIKMTLRYPIAKVPLTELSKRHIAQWRDDRLQAVSAASVRREWNLLNHAMNIAVREWEWLRENPMKSVQRPSPPPSRERVFTEDEIDRICYVAGLDDDAKPVSTTQRVAAAFLFAIETGMRAGEIAALRPEHIDMEQRTARLLHTKNGHPRTVPLSQMAVRILQQLPAGHFDLTPMQISSIFRKLRDRAMIEDATFHDSRHTAITRLAKKLDVLDLARMVGTRDLKMLMVYYNEAAEEIARKLD